MNQENHSHHRISTNPPLPLRCDQSPATDPSPIFELYRGSFATELLVAAVAHFDLVGKLRSAPRTFDDLRQQLGLEPRPANVLLTAIRAMGLIVREPGGQFNLTPLAREHLLAGDPFFMGDYLGLAAQNPGVLEMVRRLRSNRPAQTDAGGAGAAFIYREGIDSAMEAEASARHLTLALAGRAKNVAPTLAQLLPVDRTTKVLDVGGGTGIYSCALLQRNPQLRAVVFDRPEVLKIAAEMADTYGVTDRLECVPGDMFRSDFPAGCDLILLSNILHDWDVPECENLIRRCINAMPSGGKLVIHDVFLNDDLGGPLPTALYSASLFTLTEGRAYSAAEYSAWLTDAGLQPGKVIPTLVHCGLLIGTKP